MQPLTGLRHSTPHRPRSVVLCLSGHDHPGGYACIQHVHFVTVEAMLEGE